MLCPLFVDECRVCAKPSNPVSLSLSFFLLLAFAFLLPFLWLYPFCRVPPHWGLKTSPCLRSYSSSSQSHIFPYFPKFLPAKIQPTVPQVLPPFYSPGLLSFWEMTFASNTPWVFHKYCKGQVDEEPYIMVASATPEYTNSLSS